MTHQITMIREAFRPIRGIPEYIPDEPLNAIRHPKGLEAGFGKKGVTPSDVKSKKPMLLKWQRNKCHYCQCQMVPTYEGKHFPDNLATVEHIYPRTDIRRALCGKIVIACYKCNNGKAAKENQDLARSIWSNIFDIRNLLTNQQ